MPPCRFGLSFSHSHFLTTSTNCQLNQCFPSSSSKHFITTNLSCAHLFPVFTQQIMAKKGPEEGVYNSKIINTDMPSLSARQSLAAQERPQGLLFAWRVIASCRELSCYERLRQVPLPPPLLLQPRGFSESQAAKLHLWVIISNINYCVLPNYPLLTHSVGLQEQCKVGKQWHLKMIGP